MILGTTFKEKILLLNLLNFFFYLNMMRKGAKSTSTIFQTLIHKSFCLILFKQIFRREICMFNEKKSNLLCYVKIKNNFFLNIQICLNYKFFLIKTQMKYLL